MSIDTDHTKLRARILALLGDDQIAKVATAEGQNALVEGDEFLDLADLGRGVQEVHDVPVAAGQMLPRSSVPDTVWTEILHVLKP
jgi:hypothetical protein